MLKKEVYIAIATLIGTIIGAGILGIPYVVAKSGFLTGIIDIVLIGIALLFLNLYLGEITLRTKGTHQLTGYAMIYLGKWGRKLMNFAMIFGIYGALIAYLIKEGQFFHVLIGKGFPLLYTIIFFILASYLVYKGLKEVGASELYMVSFVLLVVVIIAGFSVTSIDVSNLAGFGLGSILIPYGVVFFAFLGTSAIPQMREELVMHKDKLKKAIIIGSLIPVFVYVLFALVVVGVVGIHNITEESIIGLGAVLGRNMLIFGTIFGILTMATSYIALGHALKEMYIFDYGKKRLEATLLTVIIPLVITIIMVMTEVKNAFFKVIDITGAISGGLTGVLIILMLWKSRKRRDRKPEYSLHKSRVLEVILIIMFVFGMIYELAKIFGFISF